VPPAAEPIDPRLDSVFVGRQFLDAEASLPSIVAERLHGHFEPVDLATLPIEKRRGQRIVPVGEDVGAHDDVLTQGAPDGKTPGIDFRMDALDHDAPLQCGVE